MKVINYKSQEKEKLNWSTDGMDKNYVKKTVIKNTQEKIQLLCINKKILF